MYEDTDAAVISMLISCHAAFINQVCTPNLAGLGQEFDADKAIAKMMAGPNWPRIEYMRGSEPLSAAEIKEVWAANAAAASAAGTYTHLQCEAVLNGGAVEGSCLEMKLLSHFFGSTRPLMAYRTEWCIWATAERLAGCIDFAAMDEHGQLVSLGNTLLKLLPVVFLPVGCDLTHDSVV